MQFDQLKRREFITLLGAAVLIQAAPVVLIIFALLLPANAQFWGNSWGGRQQQPQQPYNPYAQQPYNPYGGFGGDRQWGYGGYGQRERPSSPARGNGPEKSRRSSPRITPTRRRPRRARMPRSRSW
jgi:hypothetical protein